MEDTDAAKRLYSDLERAGLHPWLWSEDILPGDEIEVVIRKAIETSRHFIVLLSKSIEKRGFNIQTELKYALDKRAELPESYVFLIPARLEICEIPNELKNIVYVDLFPNWEEGVRRILLAVGSREPPLQNVPPVTNSVSEPSIRFKLSPSVQESLSEFDGKKVSASALVNSILKRHPEYGNSKAKSIHLEEVFFVCL
jgi:TIR domain